MGAGGGKARPGDTGYGQGNTAPSSGTTVLPAPSFGAAPGASGSGATTAPVGTPMVNSGSRIGFAGQPQGPVQALRADGIFRIYNNDPMLVPLSTMEPLIQKWAFSTNAEDQAKYKAIVAQMQQAKLVTDKGTPALSSVAAAWSQVLLGASYNTQYTPLEYLGLLAQQGATNITGSTPDASSGPTTNVNTTTTTKQSNVFDAKALLNNALSTYLGRQATQQELDNFKAMLNEQEVANPTTTVTTTKATPGKDGNSTSSSNPSTTGGVNAAVVAEEFAKSRGNYAETQANTTLMGWLEEAIRGSQDRMI